MIMLAAFTGLRIAEICAFTVTPLELFSVCGIIEPKLMRRRGIDLAAAVVFFSRSAGGRLAYSAKAARSSAIIT